MSTFSAVSLTIAFSIKNIDNLADATLVKDTLSETYLIPDFISELAANAASRWKNDQPFMGQTLNLPNNKSKKLYVEVLDIVSKWERKTLIADITTVFDLYDLLYQNNLIEDKSALISAISDDAFNEKLFLCLFNNQDFKTLLPTFINYGMSTILEGMNVNSNQEFISAQDFNSLSREDIKNEAHYFGLTIRQINELKSLKGHQLSEADYRRILQNLNEIKDSKILGTVVYNVVYKLFQNYSY